MGDSSAERHYADAENWAIEHAHHHDHPEVGRPEGALHHRQWGSGHPHEHRFLPERSNHHPVEPHPIEFPDPAADVVPPPDGDRLDRP